MVLCSLILGISWGLVPNGAAWGFNGWDDCGAANGWNWMGFRKGGATFSCSFFFPFWREGVEEMSWRWGRRGDEVTEERVEFEK